MLADDAPAMDAPAMLAAGMSNAAPAFRPALTLGAQPGAAVLLLEITSRAEGSPTPEPPPVPSIVTSGLVLHLDAGNAASYPGSGTAWTDLTGNGNNGTLTNGPTYSAANGGQIVFDGVNDYVAVAGSRTLLDCTFNLWIKRNGSQNSGTGLLFSGNNGGGTSGIRLDFNNKLAYHWNNFFFSWDSGLTLPDNQWAMATLCIEPTRARMYLNTTESTNTGTHTSSILILNAGVNGGFLQWFLNGSIAVARLYNRALSAAEIQQNFDANRARFGL